MIGAKTSDPLLKIRGALSAKIHGQTVSSLVDRAVLRNAMISSLPAHVPVHYGKQFNSYEESATDGVTVRFADGTSERGDVLIGADGARSRVRAQRCPALIPNQMPIWTDGGTLAVDNHLLSRLSDNFLLRESRTALVRKSGARGASWLSFVHASANGPRLLWSVSLPDAVAHEYGLGQAALEPIPR